MAIALAASAVAADGPNQKFTCDMKTYVPFDATTTVTVECPDPAAAKWLESHLAEWFGAYAPKVKAAATGAVLPGGEEAYAATTDADGVKISANTLAGVRWASYTLRQLVIAKRGTFKTEGYIIPKLSITDRPHLEFRAVHLCWSPEGRPTQIERAIRLAALLKFNYAIIEPWGMYGSEKHPWWHWPNPTMTKAEVSRLVAIGKDLGITLIPQLNAYGHATSARGCTQKHAMLDLQPEYEPLFEPGGWNWCISNPETQRVLRELIAEMHENFGNPPFFHLGCDEADPQTCPECVKTPNDVLVCRHITGLAEFVKSRGARAMIWHDMLLERGDPRWKGFVHHGTKLTATLADTLPMNANAMKPMADYIAKIGGFGFIETTWHHLRGADWQKMYMSAAHAAWGSPVSHGVSFQRSLRMVGHDMKITDYLDTGHLNYQVPPGWWVDNN